MRKVLVKIEAFRASLLCPPVDCEQRQPGLRGPDEQGLNVEAREPTAPGAEGLLQITTQRQVARRRNE
jgi:hypothetical protein